MTFEFTRDSVAAGDDAYAPHLYRFRMPAETSLTAVLQFVLAQHYLASISSGKATWVAWLHNKPVAVLAQQWHQPVLLRFDSSLPQQDEIQLHFEYCRQRNQRKL